MAGLAQVEYHGNGIAHSLRNLSTYVCDQAWDANDGDSGGDGVEKPLLPAGVSDDAHHARRSILSHVSQIQILLEQPADFLQRLARQNQMLACLRWLSEYQVLACIPLQGRVPSNDVAVLLGVPESQLVRIVQMTATEGFLCQPEPGKLAHTALSAPFVEDPSLQDAALFLSEIAAPTAFQMAAATRRWGLSLKGNETPYNIALNTSKTFSGACQQSPRMRRQWPSYLQYGMGDVEAGVTDILTKLDWRSLGNSTIVDMSSIADSHELTATLASRIVVQQRTPGAPQQIRDAALFIVRLPATSHVLSSRVSGELNAHIGALSLNPRARLLLVIPSVLRDTGGGTGVEIEVQARLRDLAFWQLTNEGELDMEALIGLISGVRDGAGQLAIVNKFAATHHPAIAFEIRYQTYTQQAFMHDGYLVEIKK
ncbi:hypothetical protein GL218_05399 [Daldinia childiae]|uniref:uncharacterized protein n=1 Tax=Daldinia childiae TaxID=326645 RepID=UPI00144886B1|nr:uncharacterized protein GL218_05399 [Daldinia childiae]KAF3058613.1 hypothetical protein GL218_05399 [Daldinia childiae]